MGGGGGTPIPASVWNHLAGVYNQSGGLMETYLNVTTYQSKAASGTLADAAYNYIGADPGVGGAGKWFLNGLVGEICIFNRALTFLEVQRHYLATKWRYR